MNFKPAERQENPLTIRKLQDLDCSIEGTFVDVAMSKMGSRVYHIRRDFDLVRIFGFKDLDEQMVSIRTGSLVRITYRGSEPAGAGKIRHLATVEVADDPSTNLAVEPEKQATELSMIERSHTLPAKLGTALSSEATSEFLKKLGILK